MAMADSKWSPAIDHQPSAISYPPSWQPLQDRPNAPIERFEGQRHPPVGAYLGEVSLLQR
jgi:hypothetical protein